MSNAKTLSKRVLALILAITTVAAFTPAIAWTQQANAADSDTIYLGGETYTGTAAAPVYGTTDSKGIVSSSTATEPSSWNIKWDGTTLALNQATISGTANSIPIHTTTSIAGLTINLMNGSTNIVTACTTTDNSAHALYNYNTTIIGGDGTLTLSASGTNLSSAIFTNGKALTIQGSAKVNATSSVLAGSSMKYGIYCGDLAVKDSAQVSATGGALSGTPSSESAGIRCQSVTMSGGMITAFSKDGYGIYSNSNGMTMTGGTLNAQNPDGITPNGAGGISLSGNITISGGTVNALGKTKDGVSGNIITISGTASVNTAGSYGISSRNTVAVEGGTIISAGSTKASDCSFDLTKYTDPHVFAGADASSAKELENPKTYAVQNYCGKNNKYLKISDTVPTPTSSTPSTPVTPPTPATNTSTTTNNGTTTISNVTNGTATVSGDTANITVPADAVTKMVSDVITAEKAAKDAGNKIDSNITITAPEAAADAAGQELVLPAETVNKIANDTSATLTVNTAQGVLTFDQKALDAVAAKKAAGNITIVIDKEAASVLTQKIENQLGKGSIVYSVKVITESGMVTQFNGGIIRMAFPIPAAIAPKDAVCVYIKDNGDTSYINGSPEKIEGVSKYVATTDHLSYYAIVSKAVAKKAVAVTQTKLIRASKVKNLRAAANTGSITLKWTKVSGMKYKVYKHYNNKYNLIATTSAGTYKDTNVKHSGLHYSYKVRGYKVISGKRVYTKYSSVTVIAK
jgi:hypothetical protein